jgi:hypothetical protein
MTLLYIPKSNHAYWSLISRSSGMGKTAQPFVATAMTGIAMIDGLPDPDPEIRWTEFGLNYYPRPTAFRVQPPTAERKQELCARAAAWGFEKIIVLEADEHDVVTKTVWFCRQGPVKK